MDPGAWVVWIKAFFTAILRASSLAAAGELLRIYEPEVAHIRENFPGEADALEVLLNLKREAERKAEPTAPSEEPH